MGKMRGPKRRIKPTEKPNTVLLGSEKTAVLKLIKLQLHPQPTQWVHTVT